MAIRKRKSISEIVDEYFADLDEWVEKFGETFTQRPSLNLRNCSIEPLKETTITPTEVLVTVDLPFTSKSTVKMKPLGSNTIEISAQMKKKIRLDRLGVSHCRGEFQKFHCHLHIPVPVKMDKIKVDYRKGILGIRLPRRH